MDKPGTSQPSAGDSAFQMINVIDKPPTRRRAIAQGRLHAAEATIDVIRRKALPKGDALAIAEVAGIMAAKRVSETLPLCHPLPLDAVRVWCEVEAASVSVSCEVIAVAKTGVEMEALNGAMAALLCIYDLTKAIDPALSISDIHLQIKEGGKSGVWTHPRYPAPEKAPVEPSLGGIRAGVVTVSDRCSRGAAEDRSGPWIREFLQRNGASALEARLVPDEKAAIQDVIRGLARDRDLLVLTGGTGLGPRDVTPEAIRELGGKPVPGVGELLRASGARQAPMAWLSRSEATLLGKTLVICLPGSLKAVREGMESLLELLPHAVEIARGGAHG